TTLHLTDIAGEQINFIHGSGATTAVGDDGSATKPQQFMLYQNYPNPFNAETVISFDVREKCHVSLKIFDLLGRLQRSLVAREMEPGSHSVRVNSNALSSGVYLYRIEMGGYSAVRKMVVLD
ncbi:MAG: T9SS type A sorting domain-containing protein, partial [Candidatus Lokiarchaeota archaeon]|nr:T9SS type A sorting domain-containing protein [Candidatus Lokiarchaeota archaeon]